MDIDARLPSLREAARLRETVCRLTLHVKVSQTLFKAFHKKANNFHQCFFSFIDDDQSISDFPHCTHPLYFPLIPIHRLLWHICPHSSPSDRANYFKPIQSVPIISHQLVTISRVNEMPLHFPFCNLKEAQFVKKYPHPEECVRWCKIFRRLASTAHHLNFAFVDNV